MELYQLLIVKKNLIKPPHGEYIAVEQLESSYQNSPLVGNIYVHASSEDNNLVALVQPNKSEFQKKIPDGENYEKFCKTKEAEKLMLKSLQETWEKLGLENINKISNCALYTNEWSVDSNWLTATMKLKRSDIQKEQEPVLKRLYDELNESQT